MVTKRLVARAFVAWELKLPEVLTPQEYRENAKKDHSSSLLTPREEVPDPKTLSDWVDEDQGKIHYHPISDDSPYSFLKAQCTPPQRISPGTS